MATQPMAQQGGDPGASGQGAPDASSQQGGSAQQANQLQETLAQMLHICNAMGAQNTIIQPEMQEAGEAIRKAFVKTLQNAGPPQPQPQAPPM